MKSNFQGQLEPGMLVNLLQYLAMNGADGVLRLKEYGAEQAALYFEKGRLVHIAYHGKHGAEALAPLLRWGEGLFSFRAGVRSPATTIELPLDSLLLKAAYAADSGGAQNGALKIDLDSVLAPASEVDEDSRVSLPLRALELLRRLDGKSSLAEIAVSAKIPAATALEWAAELYQQGLVRIVASPRVSADFLEALVRLTRNIMGPVADIVVEDTLFDLGLTPDNVPRAAVDELIDSIGRQLTRQDWRRDFEGRARTLCARHRIAGSWAASGRNAFEEQ